MKNYLLSSNSNDNCAFISPPLSEQSQTSKSSQGEIPSENIINQFLTQVINNENLSMNTNPFSQNNPINSSSFIETFLSQQVQKNSNFEFPNQFPSNMNSNQFPSNMNPSQNSFLQKKRKPNLQTDFPQDIGSIQLNSLNQLSTNNFSQPLQTSSGFLLYNFSFLFIEAHFVLLDILIKEKSASSLCTKILSFFSSYFQSEYGAVYVNNLGTRKFDFLYLFPNRYYEMVFSCYIS